MRAREISLFVICLSLAIPLISMTEIYASGPAGLSLEGMITNILISISVSAVVLLLLGGGVSVAGFSFRVPAVLSGFMVIYSFSATLLTTTVKQIIQPSDLGTMFAAVFGVLFIIIGYYAALEIAGSSHGPMQ